MRYTPLQILSLVQSGSDLLGNPIEEITASEAVYAAHTSGETVTLVQESGREVTGSTPEIWTNAPAELLLSAAGVRLGQGDLRILEVQPDLRGGWSLIKTERWKA